MKITHGRACRKGAPLTARDAYRHCRPDRHGQIGTRIAHRGNGRRRDRQLRLGADLSRLRRRQRETICRSARQAFPITSSTSSRRMSGIQRRRLRAAGPKRMREITIARQGSHPGRRDVLLSPGVASAGCRRCRAANAIMRARLRRRRRSAGRRRLHRWLSKIDPQSGRRIAPAGPASRRTRTGSVAAQRPADLGVGPSRGWDGGRDGGDEDRLDARSGAVSSRR